MTLAPLGWQDRIDNYVQQTGFPRSLLVNEDGRVVGTWITGNGYRFWLITVFGR